MKHILLTIAICVAVVPLPPKRGDGGPVQYVPLKKLPPGMKLVR